MKKSAVKLLSLFFALTLFVACENAPKATEEAEESSTIEKVEVITDSAAVIADTVNVEVAAEEVVD